MYKALVHYIYLKKEVLLCLLCLFRVYIYIDAILQVNISLEEMKGTFRLCDLTVDARSLIPEKS
jgi:hypothetical protein